ncbi:MAG: NUDIX hydrolase [Gammaproteobacteria bacterium]|nr:NUDIX hydrolase [Gammaproteobacteria bacterium]
MSENKKLIYHGKIIDLYLEKVALPNGALAELEIVHHPGGAAVVALDGNNLVCMLRQYRYAAGGWCWELPAGKLENTEPPLKTAQRELAEEAGVEAARWQSLGKIVSSPGVFTEIVHLFLARDLTGVAARPEEHELIEIHWMPLAQALAWAHSGVITDAKTLAGLLRIQKLDGINVS